MERRVGPPEGPEEQRRRAAFTILFQKARFGICAECGNKIPLILRWEGMSIRPHLVICVMGHPSNPGAEKFGDLRIWCDGSHEAPIETISDTGAVCKLPSGLKPPHENLQASGARVVYAPDPDEAPPVPLKTAQDAQDDAPAPRAE